MKKLFIASLALLALGSATMAQNTPAKKVVTKQAPAAKATEVKTKTELKTVAAPAVKTTATVKTKSDAKATTAPVPKAAPATAAKAEVKPVIAHTASATAKPASAKTIKKSK